MPRPRCRRSPGRARRRGRARTRGERMARMGGFAGMLVAMRSACGPRSHARADEWPSRPVKIVVAFAPGGSADQFGRLMAAELSAALQAAILRREPAGQQRRHRIGAGRARGARRLYPADRRLRAASHRSRDQSEYRLRAAQGFHPYRDDRRRQLRLGRQSGAGREIDRRAGRAGEEPQADADHLRPRPARARSGIC